MWSGNEKACGKGCGDCSSRATASREGREEEAAMSWGNVMTQSSMNWKVCEVAEEDGDVAALMGPIKKLAEWNQ